MVRSLAAAVVLFSLLPIAAHADPLSETVRLTDLDLSSRSGRDAASRRLDIAVDRVCSDRDDATLSGRDAYEACRADTLSRTRPALDRLIVLAQPVPAPVQMAGRGDVELARAGDRAGPDDRVSP